MKKNTSQHQIDNNFIKFRHTSNCLSVTMAKRVACNLAAPVSVVCDTTVSTKKQITAN